MKYSKIDWDIKFPKGSPYGNLMEALYNKDLVAVRVEAATVPDINHITNFYEDYSLEFRAKYGDQRFCYEPTTPLLFAIRIGSMEIIKCLVEEFGADVNFHDETNDNIPSPLYNLIAEHNSKERISYLVSKGADINDIRMGKDKYTAVTRMLYNTLQFFWWHRHFIHLDYLRFLKSQGADFNKKSCKYRLDVYGKKIEIGPFGEKASMSPVEILLEKAINYYGDLAGEIYDVLIECGADANKSMRPEKTIVPDHWKKRNGEYPTIGDDDLVESIFNSLSIF